MQTLKLSLRVAAPIVVLSTVLLASTPKSNASLLIDTYTGAARSTVRPGDAGFGVFIEVTQDVTINRIETLVALGSDTNLKFVIFDHATHNLLFETGPKAFTADAGTAIQDATWKSSDGFSFTLLAGNRYDLGAMAESGSHRWLYDTQAETANGITTLVSNPNWQAGSFNAPATQSGGGHAGADQAIRLYDDFGNNNAVPEPATFVIWTAIGLAGVGFVRRRRSQK